MSTLEGKVAVVTGGASGIGAATVRLFAESGAKVVIADLQDELAGAIVSEIGPASVAFSHTDVTQEADVAGALDLAVSTFGDLDIVSETGLDGVEYGLVGLAIAEHLAIAIENRHASQRYQKRHRTGRRVGLGGERLAHLSILLNVGPHERYRRVPRVEGAIGVLVLLGNGLGPAEVGHVHAAGDDQVRNAHPPRRSQPVGAGIFDLNRYENR